MRQIVGYDRFEGQQAYMQLSELYRALRLYVNFFQPSMKLKKKCRTKSKIIKTYYPAQTPFQRLKDTGHVKNSIIRNLDSVNLTLDPVRLLKQIQFLQDALWRHIILAKQVTPPNDKGTQKLYGFEIQSNESEFLEGSSGKINDENLILKPGIIKRRQYRKTKKPRVKHWWRTRKDPFEEDWNEISSWLETSPERTAKSVLAELQKKYPEKYTKGQLRTLQRRIKAWRKKAIIMYDDSLLKTDRLVEDANGGNLKAITVDSSEKLEGTSLAV